MFQTIDVGEVSLRCTMEGTGPLVVMLHGFPEGWMSWRHQIGPIAAKGFTACAIDVRGYGGSDKPHPVRAYGIEHLVADVTGLIEALSPGERAILIGHDWGAMIAWNTALLRPDRVKAVAGLSVPYLGVGTRSLREVFEQAFTAKGRFFYQSYFQAVGVAEAELEADIRDSLRRCYFAVCGEARPGDWPTGKPLGASLLQGMRDPDPFPAWLAPSELDYLVGEFERSGFRGPLNRYRNYDEDLAYLRRFADRKIEQPSLFVGGEKDPVQHMFGPIDTLAIMKKQMSDLRGADVLPGCGHWIQQERPREVNERLLAWLAGV